MNKIGKFEQNIEDNRYIDLKRIAGRTNRRGKQQNK